jgi:hypothetical protein
VPALPEALPPAERPAGQLVGETLKLYGRRFWPSLALGIPAACAFGVPQLLDGTRLIVVTPVVGALLFSLSYVGAVAITAGKPIPFVAPFVASCLVFLPFQFLVLLVVLPGLAWLAAVGLVVPVLALERLPFGFAFLRAYRLARADFLHALGALAALFIVGFITWATMTFLLRDLGEQGATAASVIAITVISPVFFLGMALLYFDQEARDNARRVPRR